MGLARRHLVRRDDDTAEGAAGGARPVGPVLDARGRHGARVARRNGEGALPDFGRARGRGGAHALSRWAPLPLPLGPVRLPAHVHVLRDRHDALRAEPDRLRDRRPGAPLPAARAREQRRVHGDGRAVPELRRRDRVGAPASGPRNHPPPDDDLHGRLDAGAATLRRRGRAADQARALPSRRRSGEALGAHARERPLSARGRARRVPAIRRTARAKRCSSST